MLSPLKEVDSSVAAKMSTTQCGTLLLVILVTGVSTREPVPKIKEYMTDTCTRLNSRAIISSEAGCMPRPTPVHIDTSDPRRVMYPRAIMLHQCGGLCNIYKTCVAKETRTVNVSAQWRDLLGSSMTTCGHVEVTEHVSCSCKCATLAHHCRSNQVLDARTCACVCPNEEAMEECKEKRWEWDPQRCTCQCPTLECAIPNYVWIPSRCKCGKVLEEPTHRVSANRYD